MYVHYEEVLPKVLCERLVDFAKLTTWSDLDAREVHFSRKGRYAFEKSENGKDLLKEIVRFVGEKTDLFYYYQCPVIHHTFLLIKMPQGVPTRLHQDRAYWTEIEDNPPSMSTAWFALEPVSRLNGCLRLNPRNRVKESSLLNKSQPLHEHQKDSYTSEQAALTIVGEIQPSIVKTLADANCNTGDMVVFDALEPHCSHSNSTESPRHACKIVFGEKEKLNEYFAEVSKIA